MKIKFSNYEWALVALVAVVFVLHLTIIGNPAKSYIFDEAHYVPAAKCMLNGTVCNVEHPPLAKAAIAVGITLFGDNGVGWRLPTVLAGTLTIIIVFLLTRRFSDEKTAFLAAFLLAFESMWFTHSSIAMLDIIAFFFAMAGVYLFMLNRLWLAGIALGIGMLAKETVLFIVIALVAYTLLKQEKIWSKETLKKGWNVGFVVCLAALLTFLLGLGIYDTSYNAFPSPLHHVARMIKHNEAISAPRMSDAVHPLRWFSGFPAASYFVTSVAVSGGSMKRMIMQYLGQANLIVLLFLWLSVPLLWPEIRQKKPLELLNVLLIAVPFLIFTAIAYSRITYPFYMLIFIPSVCIINALALVKLPRNVVIVYCLAVLVWFFYWFPMNPLALGA
jgi:dolichyl-phosphate-mannose-protein mannosyltransferase